MRIEDELDFRFEHFFISAAVAKLNGVNRLRLSWSNAHNPALAADAINIHEGNLRNCTGT